MFKQPSRCFHKKKKKKGLKISWRAAVGINELLGCKERRLSQGLRLTENEEQEKGARSVSRLLNLPLVANADCAVFTGSLREAWAREGGVRRPGQASGIGVRDGAGPRFTKFPDVT